MTQVTQSPEVQGIQDLLQEVEKTRRNAEDQISGLMAKVRDLADSHSGAYQLNGKGSSSPAATQVTSKPGKRGRRKKGETESSNDTPKRGRGRRGDGPSLRETVETVLADRSMWKHLGEEIPRGTKGLTIAQLRKIIDATGMWTSKSKNISNQIQQEIYKLKDKKRVGRDEETRQYFLKS